jgi:hypothetical protein
LGVVQLVNMCLVFLAAVLTLRLLFSAYLPLLALFTYSWCDGRFTMCSLWYLYYHPIDSHHQHRPTAGVSH